MAALPPTVTQRQGSSVIVNEFFHSERPTTTSRVVSDSNPSKNRLGYFALRSLLGLSVAKSELLFVPPFGTRHNAAGGADSSFVLARLRFRLLRCNRLDARSDLSPSSRQRFENINDASEARSQL